ncbi:hypothetical protein LTS18_010673 [Coniosporium uncinatum]|uniref:Uncharacterized protein n=1 Tax=Coniosporium uncinatum TaxID=93489 RepID=A0ACC3DYT6_9PEZI|nr:hypothetical protein LTS18_010673 [Coniosporium uncinatum]
MRPDLGSGSVERLEQLAEVVIELSKIEETQKRGTDTARVLYLEQLKAVAKYLQPTRTAFPQLWRTTRSLGWSDLVVRQGCGKTVCEHYRSGQQNYQETTSAITTIPRAGTAIKRKRADLNSNAITQHWSEGSRQFLVPLIGLDVKEKKKKHAQKQKQPPENVFKIVKTVFAKLEMGEQEPLPVWRRLRGIIGE